MYNEPYMRKAIPFLKELYFSNRSENILFQEINSFINKYNNLPTKETILVEMGHRKDLNDDEVRNTKELLSTISPEDVDENWLVDTTEKFCKDRAVHNAVLSGIKILDGKDKKQTPEAIPHILSDAGAHGARPHSLRLRVGQVLSPLAAVIPRLG